MKSFLLLSFVLLSTCVCRGQISFQSDFESGSLGSVEMRGREVVYADSTRTDSTVKVSYYISPNIDPLNPVDSLSSSARWFCFQINGMNGEEITLQLQGNDSLVVYGADGSPSVEWLTGTDAKRAMYSYDGVDFVRFTQEEMPQMNLITKRFDASNVYVAFFAPYTCSYLKQRLDRWAENECAGKITIGKSARGRDIDGLVITNPNGKRNKLNVYIHGRIHPCESPASWHLDAMLDILTGDSNYADALRDNIVFHVIPFANPDGVAEGRSRSNADGVNLEVNFNRPDSLTAPEVQCIKSFLKSIIDRYGHIDMALNMHSQSSSDFATYWVHSAESTSVKFFNREMLLSHLTVSDNPYFDKSDLSFSNVNSKYVEGWFWDNFGEKTMAITFETPFSFYKNDPEGEWVTVENLRRFAENSVTAIGDYFEISSHDRIVVRNPRRGKGMKRSKDDDHIYFGSDYLTARRESAEALYRVPQLPIGHYDVYVWSVGTNDIAGDESENKWVKIDSVEQPCDGRFRYKLKGAGNGAKVDNLLFVKRPQ